MHMRYLNDLRSLCLRLPWPYPSSTCFLKLCQISVITVWTNTIQSIKYPNTLFNNKMIEVTLLHDFQLTTIYDENCAVNDLVFDYYLVKLLWQFYWDWKRKHHKKERLILVSDIYCDLSTFRRAVRLNRFRISVF